jgi:hypothetical protein
MFKLELERRRYPGGSILCLRELTSSAMRYMDFGEHVGTCTAAAELPSSIEL